MALLAIIRTKINDKLLKCLHHGGICRLGLDEP